MTCGFNRQLTPIDVEKNEKCINYGTELFVHIIKVIDLINAGDIFKILAEIQEVVLYFNMMQAECSV